MSWSDVFPILSDEMVTEFTDLASPAEQLELDEWFGVSEVFNARTAPGQHVVAASLFWNNAKAEDPELPALSRELLK